MEQPNPIEQLKSMTVAAICETAEMVVMEHCAFLEAAVSKVFEDKPMNWRVMKLEEILGEMSFWKEIVAKSGKSLGWNVINDLQDMVRLYRKRQEALHGCDDPPLWPSLVIHMVCSHDPASHQCAYWNCKEQEVCTAKAPSST